MSRTIRMFERKARKSHRCDQCPEEIPKGETYFCYVVVCDKDKRIVTFKSHRYDCVYEEHEAEEEITLSREEIEIPLVLRPLVPLYCESKEKKSNRKTRENHGPT